MATNDNLTMVANLVNPEVLAQIISAELRERIAFTSLAPIDTTLEGQPGTTVTVPRFNYGGDAQDVAEGQAIQYDKLTTGTTDLTIKKIAKGYEFTDESVLSGYGDPVGEGRKQITNAMAAKVDNDVLNTALDATLKLPVGTAIDLDLIDKIEDAFDDDSNPYKTEDETNVTGVLFLNPKDARKLRKAAGSGSNGDWTRYTELGDTLLVNGVLGQLFGWQIKTSRKLNVGTALAIKPGALRIYMKRGVNAESARDIDRKLTKFNADEIYGVAIYDDTKLLVIGDNTPVKGNDGNRNGDPEPKAPRGSKNSGSKTPDKATSTTTTTPSSAAAK
ncbi:N4-gp56 family major capsid protein (plasmid) [Furfurilactobacillus rossiae]|uniref:N4-gp56 family major capsid protein n=1 Tax=Furfurilactobacillus rossiae TaxID=231049 RepID=UPI001F274C8A|nr:N4-gp56 family major capsid protein [Furfurilactobacillus rossiae]MCF6164778.1 N4-gp56 family major capsid protein [Furfurilactobacillus rossiae]